MYLSTPLAPRPPPKNFYPKNPEISTLNDYTSSPPQSHWSQWPFTPIPKNIVTPVNVEVFSNFVKATAGPMRARLEEVLSDLRFGADTLVRGVGRSVTSSSNAPSAIEAGPRTSDALASMVKLGFIAGPFKEPPVPDPKVNGLMAVNKPDGSIRPCVNFSAPKDFSFNHGIDKEDLWPAK